MDLKKHCKVVFGSYLEAHDDPEDINNMTPSTHEFIDIEPP